MFVKYWSYIVSDRWLWKRLLHKIHKLQFDLISKRGRGANMWCFYKFCFVPHFYTFSPIFRFKFHLPPLSRDNISSQIPFFKCKQTETMKASWNEFGYGDFLKTWKSSCMNLLSVLKYLYQTHVYVHGVTYIWQCFFWRHLFLRYGFLHFPL